MRFTILILLFSLVIQAQTWNQLENEYNTLLKSNQPQFTLKKAKEIYNWVQKNEKDTSLHYAIILNWIGLYWADINPDSAILNFNKAISIINSQNRQSNLITAEIHFNNSIVYSKSNKDSSSVKEAELARKILLELNYPNYPFCIEPCNYLADYYLEKGKYQKALDLFNDVLEIVQKNEGKINSNYSVCLSDIANIYYKMAEYNNAEYFMKESLETERQTFGEKHSRYATRLNNLGELYRAIGSYLKAETYHKQAAELRKSLFGENSKDYAISLNNLGTLYLDIGNFKLAEDYYKKTIEVKKKILGENSLGYSISLNNIGIMYKKIGDYKLAEDYYKQSLEIKKRILGENHISYAMSLNNLGGLYQTMGNKESTELCFKKSLQIRRSVLGEYHPDFASSLNNLGTVYFNFNLNESADSCFRKAIKINDKVFGNENLANAGIYANIGSVYYSKNDFKAAADQYLISINIMEKTFGKDNPECVKYLSKIGNCYVNLKKFELAEFYLKTANHIIEKAYGKGHPEYVEGLNNLGLLYFCQKDYKKTFYYYNEGFKYKKNQLNKNFLWLSEAEREKYWKAESNYFNWINTLSFQLYDIIPSYCELAFNSILVSNGLLLASNIEFNNILKNINDEKITKIYQTLKEKRMLHNKLLSEGSEKTEILKKINEDADSLDKVLSMKISEYSIYFKQFQTEWKSIQNELNSNEIVIQFINYFNDKDTTYDYAALIIKRNYTQPILVKLCKESDLYNFSPETELNEIYQLIWKPISEKLAGIKTIYYTPVGLINNIPLQALYLEKEGVKEYLMDKYTLNQLTSTRYLALGLKKKEQEPIETSIALFGGVDYDAFNPNKTDTTRIEDQSSFVFKYVLTSRGNNESLRSGLEYLPGTKKEVEDIALVLKQNNWNVSVSTEKNASENSIKSFDKKNNKSIMHIATHGFAIPERIERKKQTPLELDRGYEKYTASDNPMIRSGLLLSGANWTWQGKGDTLLKMTKEDGVLTAYELSQLDLSNIKLVVLSACQTGKGAIQGSEGTFGLKRALKLAGVENMIVSLWDVPDEPTMEMMTLFYTELAKTKKPVSAFEFAQKTMRDKYPNEPSSWAGFVFVR